MPAPKGTRPPAAGKGRPKGAGNKLTRDVKAGILGALNAKGGQKWLEQEAAANPVTFMTRLGKVLPMQVAGSEGAPIQLNVVRYDVDTGAPRNQEEPCRS
jgi:hypothetical protein